MDAVILENKNENTEYTSILFKSFYMKYFRKFNLIFYVSLAIVYHGLQIELYRSVYLYDVIKLMELIFLFLIIFDIIMMKIFFIEWKDKLSISILTLLFFISIIQIGLKIWNPVNLVNSQNSGKGWIITVNILRIIISLFLLFLIDEKEIIKLKQENTILNEKSNQNLNLQDESEGLEKIEIIKNPKDKNQYPEYTELGSNAIIQANKIKKPFSHRGSQLRTEKNGSFDFTEVKVIEEIIAAVRYKTNQSLNEVEDNNNISELKLNLSDNLIKPFTKSLIESLDNILGDNFNIFEFDSNCLKNSIFLLMNYFFNFYKWDNININEIKFMNLIYNIQKNYNDNPYHNHIHAADVLQTGFFMLEKLEIRQISDFNKLDILLLLLSAAVHDIDHPGNSNLFEINTKSLLALTYNDKSVLENYHLFLFFNFLQNEDMNIFQDFDLNEVKNLRRIFINNVIATDITNHKSNMKKLEDNLLNDKTDKELIMTQLVHFADISNSTKQFKIYQKWVNLLFEEFFEQGDKEKEMNLPISFLCDRANTSIPESQIFFINMFTVDMTNVFVKIFPKFEILIKNLEINKKLWEDKKGNIYEIDLNIDDEDQK